jgi:uncharacterized phiE125 gp8 family phage protein
VAIDSTVALVALADAKAFLKISASTEDVIVGDIVNAVSGTINRYCGRVFLSAEYTEFYDGTGTRELILRKFPVTSVTSLNDDVNRQWTDATAKDVNSDVILDGGAGILSLWNNGGRFARGRQNVKIVYTAGYALAAIPYDVQMSCKLLASQHYRQSYAQWRRGVQSEQQGNVNTTYSNDAIPKDIAMMLDPYRVRIGEVASDSVHHSWG